MAQIYSAKEVRQQIQARQRTLNGVLGAQRAVENYVKVARAQGTNEADIETEVNNRYTEIKLLIADLVTGLNTVSTNMVHQVVVNVGRPALLTHFDVTPDSPSSGIQAIEPSDLTKNWMNVFDVGDVVEISDAEDSGNNRVATLLAALNESAPSTEMLANSGFTGSATSWTLGANWSYSANTALHSAGDTATLEQATGSMNVAPSAGSYYKIICTITGRTAGSISLAFAGTTAGVGQTATFTTYIVGASVSNLIITPTSDFDGAIDSVAITPLPGIYWSSGTDLTDNTTDTTMVLTLKER